MSKKESNGLVRVKSTTEKYKPEALPTLNSCDNMCTKDAQEYYFLFAHNYKKPRRLSKHNL